jgi:ADP-dependent NAD(P)H-hydrate dehydratase / NAD(P)H-hydrate epimerase
MELLVTPAAMGEADRRTIAAGTPVDVLMERAGRAVAWQLRRVFGSCRGRRVVIVCGKGNNGGDGLVAARALRAWGTHVAVFELAHGVDRAAFTREIGRADAVVDAMYGTGFSGELRDDAAFVAGVFAAFAGPVVAVDIPSGIDGLTGEARGLAVRATHTVTFAARKPGLVFEPGRAYAGEVTVAEIGIDLGDATVHAVVLAADDVREALAPRPAAAHKWQSGVYVVGGSRGMTGAPMFVSHAAMRAGAGIVWCGLPGDAAARAASGSEVITKALPATDDGMLTTIGADAVLADVDRFRALAVGPGLGTGHDVHLAVRRLVAGAAVPLVLDADGLNALEGRLAVLQTRQAPTVVTPHEGEYRRLAGREVGPDRLAAARALAAASGAVVLLKGPGTVIADPSGATFVNPTGGATLATAGSGDVLTGIIAGFLARGLAAFAAAAVGAWVHGAVADRFAEQVGPGLVASDLVAGLPPTLAAL